MTMPNVSEPAPTSDTATLEDVIAGTDTPKTETPVTPVEETPAVPESETPAPDPTDPPAEPAAEPEPETPLLEVSIPHFRPDQPPLTLAGVPQEAADAIRHLANTAAKADQLSQRVTQLSDTNADDQATLSLLKEQPLESMFLLHQQHPDVGRAFAGEWLQMNAAKIVPLLKELDILTVDPGSGEMQFVDPRMARFMADNAKLRAEKAVDNGRKGFEQSASTERVVQRIQIAVDEVAATLNITDTEWRETFIDAAEKKLVALARSKGGQVTKEDMVIALAPVAQKFHALATPATGKRLTVQQQPRDTAGRYAETQARAQTSRALAGGAAAMPAMSGWADSKDTDTLDDIMKTA